MRRVSVVGNSGSGKSTVAQALGARLGVPVVELDGLRHGPNWQQTADGVFRALVAAHAAGDGWVIDGNYDVSRDLVWGRADTVVWVDLPRHVVTARILRRSLRRVARGEELWNGNRESWRDLCSLDPERSVVLWSITRHRLYRRRYAQAAADPALARLHFVRLRTRGAVRRWLRSVPAQASPPGGGRQVESGRSRSA